MTCIQATVESHAAQLEGVLGQATKLREELGQLLSQLEEMRGRLKSHDSPRVSPPNIMKQLEGISVSMTLKRSSYINVLFYIMLASLSCLYATCVYLCSQWNKAMKLFSPG